MGQNRCRRSGRRACVTVNGRAWNVGQPAYSQSDRSAVDAIAALGGGGGTVSAPWCSTSTPPVATMRVEPVGRVGCRSRSSRYWSEPTESSATERAGEPLSGTQGRGAHSLTIRRAIASSSSSVRARWRRRISRPRRLAASCTESARARPRPRAHHQCEFKRDETMHVKARKRVDALLRAAARVPARLACARRDQDQGRVRPRQDGSSVS